MKSLIPRLLPVFRECVNSRPPVKPGVSSLGQHTFFFRKPVVNVGLFNGFINSQALMVYILFIINVLRYNSSWILGDGQLKLVSGDSLFSQIAGGEHGAFQVILYFPGSTGEYID